MKRVEYNGRWHVFPDEATEAMILEALGVSQGPTVDSAGTYAGDVVKSIIRGAAQIPLQVPRFVGAVGDYIREKVGDEQGRVFGDIGTEPGSAFTSVAESVDNWIQETIPPSQFGKTGFWRRDVPEGVGQFVPMLGGGLAGAAMTKAGKTAAETAARKSLGAAAGAGTMGFFAETMDAFDRELERQVVDGEERNPDKAFAKSILYGFASSAIEGQFGAGRIARKLSPGAINQLVQALEKKGVSKSALLNFSGRVGKEATVGGLQEATQRTIQDLIVDGRLSPQDISHEAAIGGVVQGLFGIPVAISQRRSEGIAPAGNVKQDLDATDELNPPPGLEVAPTGGPGERFAATITPEEAPIEYSPADYAGGDPNARTEELDLETEEARVQQEAEAAMSPKPLTSESVLPLAAAEAATQEGPQPPPGSPFGAGPAAGRELPAAAALPPAITQPIAQGTEISQEGGELNAIQEGRAREEAVPESIGQEVQREAGAGVLRDRGMEQASAETTEAPVVTQEGGVAREEEVQRQEAVTPVPPAPTAPAVPAQANESKKSITDSIRSLKIDTKGKMFDATLGIPTAVWNGLVEAVALAVQAGMAVRDAVAKVIGDYKDKNPNSPIDEIRVAAELTRQVTQVTKAAGERTITKRIEASPDISPEVKDMLTNKLYRVLKDTEAQAVVDQIMRTVPSIDSAIALFNDTHRQLPEWVRGLLGGGIINEFTKQERAAEKAGDQALAEQLRIRQASFVDTFATYGTEAGRAVNVFKLLYKMTPAGVKAWAVRNIENAAGVDISNHQSLLDKVHQILGQSFTSSRRDVTTHKDVTKWLNEWIDRQLVNDSEIKEAAKKAGVNAARLLGILKIARNANRQGTPLPQNATDLEKLVRAKIPVAITRVKEAIATARTKEGPIGEELAALLGMSNDDAKAFAGLVKRLQNLLETDRKRRAIAAFLKGLDKRLPVRVEEIVKKIVQAEELGALSNREFQEKMRQMFRPKKLTPEKIEELGKLAEEMHKIPEDQANKKARAYQKILNEVADMTESWWNLPMAIWYANMLSGITTQYLNTVSTALNAMGEWATTIGQGPGAFLTASNAFFGAIRQGFQEAMHTMRTGEVPTLRALRTEPGRPLERLDNKGWKGIVNKLKYVTRFMGAQDLLAFVPLMHMKEALLVRSFMIKEGMPKDQARRAALEQVFGTEKARSDAAAQAASEGYVGLEAKRRVMEIIQSCIDDDIRRLAADFGRRATFNQLHGYGLMGALVRGVNTVLREVPGVRLIVPFVNVVGNVVNEGLNYSPIGTARAASSWINYRYRNPTGGPLKLYGDTATLEDVKDLTFKSLAATVLITALMVAAAESLDDDGNDDGEGFAIFGFGPRDPAKRDTWRAEGKIPFSLRLNGRYYNYVNSPIGIPLATIGNYFDAIRYKDLDANSALERSYFLLKNIHSVILQQSFLDGVATLLNVKDNVSPTKDLEQVTKSLGRTVSTFAIPNALRQADNFFDPKVYKPEDIQGMILQSIPFARRLGKPAVNGLGETVEYPLMARFTREQTVDPVWRELGRLNVGVYPGQMVHNGERLNDQQLARVAELSGPRIRTMIERIMANPRWSELPDEAEGKRPDKKKVLQRIIEQQRTQAKRRVMAGS